MILWLVFFKDYDSIKISDYLIENASEILTDDIKDLIKIQANEGSQSINLKKKSDKPKKKKSEL